MEKKSSKENTKKLIESLYNIRTLDWNGISRISLEAVVYIEAVGEEIDELKGKVQELEEETSIRAESQGDLMEEIDSLRKENDRLKGLIEDAFIAGFKAPNRIYYWQEFKKENNIE